MNVSLKDLLSEKKPDILNIWFDEIIDTYPADTSLFLKKQKNRFHNPVGHAILHGTGEIFDKLLEGYASGRGTGAEEIAPFLDNIIRVRAVQDFTASRAVGFVFALKKAVRSALESSVRESGDIRAGLEKFDSMVDGLALAAFDIYMQCREKIYALRAEEIEKRTFRLLQQANLICEVDEEKKDLDRGE